MKKSFLLALIISLLLISIVGCGGSSNSDNNSSTINITGTVIEKGTNILLSGVTITLGNESTTTDANGNYRFSDISAGSHTVIASLSGYETYNGNATIDSNQTLDIELTTNGPLVSNQNITITDPNGTTITDGMELPDNVSVLNISGNINDLVSERITNQAGASTRSTAITIDALQVLVNGSVYTVMIEPDGSYDQNVPLNPGENTIQLRVFDNNGAAGTGQAIRVTVTIERMDIRIVLKWDTNDSDVDLHMFKRSVSEPNPSAPPPPSDPDTFIEWGETEEEFQHVWYNNKTPNDFGTTLKQNPFLDIDDTDGYGPETLVLQEATEGRYHIWLHYYAAPIDMKGGDIPSNFEVTIILKGGTHEVKTHKINDTLNTDWEYMYLCTIDWPSGEIIQQPPTNYSTTSGKRISRPLNKRKKK